MNVYTSRALISSRFKFLISSLIYSSWISRNSSCLCSALRCAYKSSSSCPSNLKEGIEQKIKMRLTVKNKNKSAKEEICESCRSSSQLTVDGDISSRWFQTLPLLDTECEVYLKSPYGWRHRHEEKKEGCCLARCDNPWKLHVHAQIRVLCAFTRNNGGIVLNHVILRSGVFFIWRREGSNVQWTPTCSSLLSR